MAHPIDVLDRFSDIVRLSGGDAAPARRAADFLKALGPSSAGGIARALREMSNPAPQPRAREPDELAEMRAALTSLHDLLSVAGRSPAWLTAYLDFLSHSDAKSADELVRLVQKRRASGSVRQRHSGYGMATHLRESEASALVDALRDEVARMEWGAAFRQVAASDLSKENAIFVARELTGVTHRSKRAALQAVRDWAQSESAANRAMRKIADQARRL